MKFFMDYPGRYGQFEIQAFTLAGYLLVPEETIRGVTLKVIADLTAASRRKQGKDLDTSSVSVWKLIAKDVARKYEVTPQAATKRLQWARLWPAEAT